MNNAPHISFIDAHSKGIRGNHHRDTAIDKILLHPRSIRHFKTGVTPYVHRDGARPPSLRRLYKKRPYFTNARAQELEGLLQMAGTAESGDFFHADPPAESARFSGEEVGALRAFLELL